MVVSILRIVTMPRNWVEILIKNPAFCLNQTLKVYLCATQTIDCNLIRVLTSLGHKNLILLLGMRSCHDHEKMPKLKMPQCSLMSMGTSLFYFKIDILI